MNINIYCVLTRYSIRPNYYCGAQKLSSLDPLHTGPKAHAEEEETLEDEQRESHLPRDIGEDNPVLG